MTKRRTKLEWYVLDVDGQDTLRTRVTKKGLKEALEQLAEWTEKYERSDLYNSFDPEDEDQLDMRNDLAPRIELYEQNQINDGFAWEQEDYYHYQPEDGGMPKKAQRLWDNR
tara:strand:+ start:38 stop:373 length:336 start_codon:yes stop_codon:yes gene_type:complete